MDFYTPIFKRRSFHTFKETLPFSEEDLHKLQAFMKEITPLDPSISIQMKLLSAKEISCKLKADYYLLFYSEKKGEYLRNIGYIGEQIDLYAVSLSIGTLWYGLGKTKEKQVDGKDFIIMMAFSKVPETSFRKDLFSASRKPLEKIWNGERLHVAEIVRFAPSAVNSQPWFTEVSGRKLSVYRTKAKVGIFPIPALKGLNCIDIGIFLFHLEICLIKEGYSFKRTLFPEEREKSKERLLAAEYTLE